MADRYPPSSAAKNPTHEWNAAAVEGDAKEEGEEVGGQPPSRGEGSGLWRREH